jgi:hypothetical protein
MMPGWAVPNLILDLPRFLAEVVLKYLRKVWLLFHFFPLHNVSRRDLRGGFLPRQSLRRG